MTKIVLAYEDFAALPDDGNRYELHEGELSVTPAPGARHQQVIGNLFLILAPHIRAAGRGELLLSPFDCIMTNITVVEPDLVYIDEDRRRLPSARALEGSPTLAIEVTSPHSIRIDRRRKLALYAAHDVPWYWIVDPEACTIEAYRLLEGAYRLEATLEGVAPRALPPFTLTQVLESIYVVEPALVDGKVAFGTCVTVEDDEGERMSYELVGPDEVDTAARQISIASPVAQALLGKRAGDRVTLRRPKGDIEVQVIAVELHRQAR